MPDEPSWRLEDTIRLAPLLAAHGVDLFDISSGGSNAKQKFVYAQHSASQASFSHAVREAVVADNITVAGSGAPLLVSAVGGIWTGAIATEVLESGWADVAFVGRKFQQSPGLVWDMARELGVEIYNAHQIEWGFTGRGRGLKRKGENQFAKKDQPSVNEEQK
jgi:2,4-dienoyl-CoA reductase-like NADH-dependent reductase (Old Yellow Enzyme family)